MAYTFNGSEKKENKSFQSNQKDTEQYFPKYEFPVDLLISIKDYNAEKDENPYKIYSLHFSSQEDYDNYHHYLLKNNCKCIGEIINYSKKTENDEKL